MVLPIKDLQIGSKYVIPLNSIVNIFLDHIHNVRV